MKETPLVEIIRPSPSPLQQQQQQQQKQQYNIGCDGPSRNTKQQQQQQQHQHQATKQVNQQKKIIKNIQKIYKNPNISILFNYKYEISIILSKVISNPLKTILRFVNLYFML